MTTDLLIDCQTEPPPLVKARRDMQRAIDHRDLCQLPGDVIEAEHEIERCAVIVSAMEAARLA